VNGPVELAIKAPRSAATRARVDLAAIGDTLSALARTSKARSDIWRQPRMISLAGLAAPSYAEAVDITSQRRTVREPNAAAPSLDQAGALSESAVNRLWERYLHENNIGVQRSNLFLVAEPLLVVGYSTMLSSGSARGPSG
jgi:hypothetical protein